MEAAKRTYCLDEADRQINDRSSDHLIAILNSGNRRSTAKVECSVPTSDGGWTVGEFDTWGAVAFSGIGELPPTLQDRSIRIVLQRATGAEVPEHLRNGSSPELVTIRRQLSAWADALFDIPEPELPELLTRQAGRVGDNWRPLIAIADLAGGQWPELARQAALEEAQAEKRQSRLERLLAAIRRAFDRQPATLPDDAPDTRDRLRSKTLIGALLADPEDDWGAANRGRVITEAWLRDRLRGLLSPPGSQQWHHGSPREHVNGYLRLQFLDAWRRYTPAQSAEETPFSAPSTDPVQPVHSVHPVHTDKNPQNSAGVEEAESVLDASTEEPIQYSNEPQKSPEFCEGVPDGLDVPDVLDLEGVGEKKRPGKLPAKKTTAGSATAYPPWDDSADLGDVIRAACAANPGRSIRAIAKAVGQPEDVVRIYLGGGAE
jgi:putative DNA primase/helicase